MNQIKSQKDQKEADKANNYKTSTFLRIQKMIMNIMITKKYTRKRKQRKIIHRRKKTYNHHFIHQEYNLNHNASKQ